MRLSRGPVAALVSAAALGLAAAPALGTPLPQLYAKVQGHHHNTVFTPVFAVRPARVDLQTPYGGTLTLKWTTWTDTVAVGHGTALPGVAVSPGQKQPTYPVDVRASRVRDGRFTRFEVTLFVNGQPAEPDHLHLTETDGQFNWMP
ncbi:MAG TPA: hypothetical protein VMA77_11225 [Solirubrobacteraceae bacterium]|nr:hypothetical protein [Solirubrobacteraceae bacterium]